MKFNLEKILNNSAANGNTLLHFECRSDICELLLETLVSLFKDVGAVLRMKDTMTI